MASSVQTWRRCENLKSQRLRVPPVHVPVKRFGVSKRPSPGAHHSHSRRGASITAAGGSGPRMEACFATSQRTHRRGAQDEATGKQHYAPISMLKHSFLTYRRAKMKLLKASIQIDLWTRRLETFSDCRRKKGVTSAESNSTGFSTAISIRCLRTRCCWRRDTV